MQNQLLINKIAVVTGGSRGIGKAIAKLFLTEGATVLLVAANAERGQAAARELKETTNSEQVFFFQCDVSQTRAVEEVFQKIYQAHERIDILINNAGVTSDNLLMRMTEEEWQSVLDVNLKSVFNTCRVAIRPMMKARSGKIINMTSVVGMMGNAGQANYAASKAGIIGFTKSLAKEVGSRGICVNCIAPGFIETDMTGQLNEKQKEMLLNQVPLQRTGRPEEIAHSALFLALSDYITGQVLVVDGGLAI